MIDIGEGMCYGEHCELCKTDGSQTCIPETNNSLNVNEINILTIADILKF